MGQQVWKPRQVEAPRGIAFLVSSAGLVLLEKVPVSAVLSVLQSWSGGAVGVVGVDQGLASISYRLCPRLRRMEA